MPGLRIAALTMVYRDYWALAQWVRHYERLVGAGNLYIVAHGPDPEVGRIAPGASIITVPRGDLSRFDRVRGDMLNAFQAGLLKAYDWVIRTDADELVCAEGGLEPILAANSDVPVLTALGFDLIEDDADTALDAAPVFARRRHASFTGHYSKACIVNAPHDLMMHGVHVRPRMVARFPYRMPEGLYLAHLKFANRAALRDTNPWRVAVATGEGTRLPGPAWADAPGEERSVYARFAAKQVVSWDEARAEAFDALSHDPVRHPRHHIVKARSQLFETRTTLPDWFAAL